jgi:iron uptake system EfeUOB component EfeO/EfeM
MKKVATIILASVMLSILVLAGCGSKDNKVNDGVNKMLETTNQLSKAINAGDQAKVKEVGPKLEDQWSSFEDDVKKDNKALYGKVEEYLDPTIAGSQAPSLDKKALSTLNNQLTDSLKELESKTK